MQLGWLIAIASETAFVVSLLVFAVIDLAM